MHLLRALAAILVAMTFAVVPALAQAPTCPELTTLQYLVGFVTLTNILMVFAVVIGVGSFSYLLFRWFSWLLEIFLHIPVQVYEVLGYTIAIGLMISGYWLSPTNEVWTSLVGSLFLAGMLMITGAIHNLSTNYERFFGTLFIVWAVIALFYQNPYVGFIAIGALMGMLGFSAAVIPCGYIIGFRDDDALARATSAAFLILIAFVVLRVIGDTLPYAHVFEQGALWLGGFVGYLGLLIASSRWWYERGTGEYIIMQVVTILLGITALAVGSVFGIPQLLGIGGTFFALYLIEKPFEIPVKSATTYATISLLVALVVGGCVWLAQNNMELVQPFLLF